MPDDLWPCTRERVEGRCGTCENCQRAVAAPLAADDDPIPPGLLLSVDERGGFAVPRQLAGPRSGKRR
jgi:hypothetical protein